MKQRYCLPLGMISLAVFGLGLLLVTDSTIRKAPASAIPPRSPTSPDAQETPGSDLVIHEWGTFLGMNGADGAALDGMYHEEHALPSFVHARSRDQLRIPSSLLKGETPVIYFYTDTPQSVRVAVGFPRGVWTQWYPQAARVAPALEEQAGSPELLRNGRICWFAEIIPPALAEERLEGKGGEIPSLPPTSADALWNHARDVDAAFVKTIDATKDPAKSEYERFLFYRGLGEARMPLHLNASQGGTLELDRDRSLGEGIRHVFVLRVENGRAAYRYLPMLKPGERISGVIPSMNAARPLSQFTPAIADDLAARLTDAGLYAKEARAMVNTWTSSYFQTEGIRVLFALPQSWTDAFIPMNVQPQPKQVVRVMVGRLELLTADRERRAEEAIGTLGHPDSKRSSEAFAYLREQGRYVEPILRRVLRTTQDEKVRTLCKRLLLTEFVTDLRAAVHNAADGTRLSVDPTLLRAQLARMLRDIGLDQEAKREGVAILNSLGQTRGVATEDHKAQWTQLAIRGAALEATGVDRAASVVYGDCIAAYAGGLGLELNRETIAECRDWWVGRAYGRVLVRAGKAEQTERDLEARLRTQEPGVCRRDVRGLRMRLAYLREARGQQAQAQRIWSSLNDPLTEGTTVADRSSTP